MTDYSKMIVYAGFAVPAVFIFFKLWEQDWSIWIPIAACGAGAYYFYDNFINKNEVRQQRTNVPGPTEPYIPAGSETWKQEWDDNRGDYVPKKTFEPPYQKGTREQPQFRPYNRRGDE